MSAEDYQRFLERKALTSVAAGMPNPPPLSPALKEHQALLSHWFLRLGRGAIYGTTGIGKSGIEAVCADVIANHTGKPVLIFTPLAVGPQLVRESARFGVSPTIASSQDDLTTGVYVTNYQKAHRFEPSLLGGVILDEASIIKGFDGKTRRLMIDSFHGVPFRMAATATPAPNDHTELGGQAEFLGIMTHAEMLATFFVHDGGSTKDWRLKGHAREAFWRWVCSWGAFINMPSDIGCDDSGYALPPLEYHEHTVPASRLALAEQGLIFAEPAHTLSEQRIARRSSLDDRVKLAADIANATSEQTLVFCDLNDESAALARSIVGAAELTGSQEDETKEAVLGRFVSGETRVLVSKPTLAGLGLNLQFCRTVVFCGLSHSFEQMFQAVRRCWRYGQLKTVLVHIVTSELEGAVLRSVKAKHVAYEQSLTETRLLVSDYVRRNVVASTRDTLPYRPTVSMRSPSWLNR